MRNQTVVIEGPDGTGKSTLAKKLVAQMGLTLTHTGGPNYDEETLKGKFRLVEDLSGEGVLFDRIPQISNYVYATVERRPAFLTLRDYQKAVEVLDPIVIRCSLRDFSLQREGVSREPKPHKPPEYLEGVLDNLASLNWEYFEFFRKLHDDRPRVRVIPYDYTRTSFDTVVETITQEWRAL